MTEHQGELKVAIMFGQVRSSSQPLRNQSRRSAALKRRKAALAWAIAAIKITQLKDNKKRSDPISSSSSRRFGFSWVAENDTKCEACAQRRNPNDRSEKAVGPFHSFFSSRIAC